MEQVIIENHILDIECIYRVGIHYHIKECIKECVGGGCETFYNVSVEDIKKILKKFNGSLIYAVKMMPSLENKIGNHQMRRKR